MNLHASATSEQGPRGEMQPEAHEPEEETALEDRLADPAAHPTAKPHAEERGNERQGRHPGDADAQNAARGQRDGERDGGDREREPGRLDQVLPPEACSLRTRSAVMGELCRIGETDEALSRPDRGFSLYRRAAEKRKKAARPMRSGRIHDWPETGGRRNRSVFDADQDHGSSLSQTCLLHLGTACGARLPQVDSVSSAGRRRSTGRQDWCTGTGPRSHPPRRGRRSGR
ncbi:UNVERIFIED_ORG: hypothetical protein M2438_004250 [Methylobacterium sp. SuP10 SLI 274]|nr:hypothetical protein [Methylorubrum extorquens]MDF9865506.1 hypothetical protein [Methylorubrum pseudosasae]MDH6639075.1 hypothetical protein [Methylobacterium sp. SuP10 SLI 274]MDH6668265.1 hypothetical protein [Methylorubrum zatmanii]